MKIVINKCYGSFGLSDKAILRYAELKGITLYRGKDSDGFDGFHTSPDFPYDSHFFDYDIPRNSSELVQTVEELKEEANDNYANLKVIEIPDDVEWTLEEYDGNEWVAEEHRIWS